jgi:hypothetical protein
MRAYNITRKSNNTTSQRTIPCKKKMHRIFFFYSLPMHFFCTYVNYAGSNLVHVDVSSSLNASLTN